MTGKTEIRLHKLVEQDGTPAVPLKEAVDEINWGLRNLGNILSDMMPYQRVQSVTVDHAAYEEKAGDVIGKITVKLQYRDMSNGDIEDAEDAYILSWKMALLAAEKAPESARVHLGKILAAFGDAKRDYDRRNEELENIFNRLGDGQGRAVKAPERAQFGKRKPDKAGPK